MLYKLCQAFRKPFVKQSCSKFAKRFFLDLETFFFSSPRKLTSASRGFSRRNLQTRNQKNLLENFAFNSFTTVMEITKIINFKLWRTFREPVVKQSCWNLQLNFFWRLETFSFIVRRKWPQFSVSRGCSRWHLKTWTKKVSTW